MAFQLVQTFNFEDVQHSYDRAGDVLYISFGSPRPAVAVQVEDWLAIRLSNTPPLFAGVTIVGFKRIFERINRYIESELPQRIERLAKLTLKISYDDHTDALIMRPDDSRPTFSLFEPLAPNLYLEKTLPSKDVVGIKITEYTRCGPLAFETMLGKIIDTLFETSSERDENAHLLTDVTLRTIDWNKIAAAAA